MMPRRLEMGGGELVCRLVAATPPYLYSPAGLPHAFFFSELLRGLVDARAKRPPSPCLSPPPTKRIRSASGSAFAAPQPVTAKPNDTQNPLSTSRILPNVASIYKTIGEKKKNVPSETIGIELVVDCVKDENEQSKPIESTP